MVKMDSNRNKNYRKIVPDIAVFSFNMSKLNLVYKAYSLHI